MNVEDVKEKMHRKIVGDRSLTLGEAICFCIGLFLLWKPILGKWSKWIAFAVMFFGAMLF